MECISLYYFSPNPGREKAIKTASWTGIVLLSAFLILYWEQLRYLEPVLTMYRTVNDSWAEYFFRGVTFLGDDEGFMLIVALVYWCINKSVGFWTLVVLLVSGGINFGVKEITGLPRPPIPGVDPPDNPAFPSGHTFSSMAVWGHLAFRFQGRKLWIVALAVVFLVGWSRLFLGYHFPGDVIGGLVFGFLFLALFFYGWLQFSNSAIQLTYKLSLKIALLIALVFLVLVSLFPLLQDLVMVFGFLSGGIIGYVLEKEKVGFKISGTWFQYGMRMLIGGAGIGIIVMVLLPLGAGNHQASFVIHGLATFWAFFVAPLVFTKLRIA